MTELTHPQGARLVYRVSELVAVPCPGHKEWTAGCPRCLTGEQAQHLGVLKHTIDHGVVAEQNLDPYKTAKALDVHVKANTGLRRILDRILN